MGQSQELKLMGQVWPRLLEEQGLQHLFRLSMKPLFPFIIWQWMSIRQREREGVGEDGDMENQHLSWIHTCKYKSTQFGFSFLQSGRFSDSYILTSKTKWIHSWIKHFKLSQSLNLITDQFCTNTSSSVLSGNQLSVHIKAQLYFLSLKLTVRPYWVTLKLTMGIILI